MVRVDVGSSFRFSLSRRAVSDSHATAGLLPSPRRWRSGRSPLLRRVVRSFRRCLIDLPTRNTSRGRRLRDDVGLSPVRFVSHFAKAKPPNTWVQPDDHPRCWGEPYASSPDEPTLPTPRFRTLRSLAFSPGRNVIPPSLIRPGPSVTVGYLPTLAAYPARCEFETDLPDGHGPARVGLGNAPSFMTSLSFHRLRLSQQILRLTRSAVTCHRFFADRKTRRGRFQVDFWMASRLRNTPGKR